MCTYSLSTIKYVYEVSIASKLVDSPFSAGLITILSLDFTSSLTGPSETGFNASGLTSSLLSFSLLNKTDDSPWSTCSITNTIRENEKMMEWENDGMREWEIEE